MKENRFNSPVVMIENEIITKCFMNVSALNRSGYDPREVLEVCERNKSDINGVVFRFLNDPFILPIGILKDLGTVAFIA